MSICSISASYSADFKPQWEHWMLFIGVLNVSSYILFGYKKIAFHFDCYCGIDWALCTANDMTNDSNCDDAHCIFLGNRFFCASS